MKIRDGVFFLFIGVFVVFIVPGIATDGQGTVIRFKIYGEFPEQYRFSPDEYRVTLNDQPVKDGDTIKPGKYMIMVACPGYVSLRKRIEISNIREYIYKTTLSTIPIGEIL